MNVRSRRGRTSLGRVRTRSTPLLLGLGALLLGACSTTALSSAPEPTEPVTVPPLPDPEPELVELVEVVEADEVDEPVDPEPAEADVDVDEGVDDETVTTTEESTTTTVPPNVVFVDEVDPPLEAVGTSSGAETARLQERLLELGFWVQGTDGQYGITTRQAVMAFQKYLGLPADGVADADTVAYMSHLTERPRGRADAGTLVEVDKTKQLLFFVIDGQTEWILNTSTGTEIPYERPNANDPEIIERGSSVTPVGLHAVNRQRAEGWWEGDLGEIYRPKYFIGGVAVHGSNSIPNYPASHGCVRVSVPAMDWIWESDLMPMHSPVWVHGEIPS